MYRPGTVYWSEVDERSLFAYSRSIATTSVSRHLSSLSSSFLNQLIRGEILFVLHRKWSTMCVELQQIQDIYRHIRFWAVTRGLGPWTEWTWDKMHVVFFNLKTMYGEVFLLKKDVKYFRIICFLQTWSISVLYVFMHVFVCVECIFGCARTPL